MNKLEIKSVTWDDVNLDLGMIDGWEKLEDWHPDDKKIVRLSLTIDIGMKGMIGTNLFWLEIYTKAYAKEKGANSKKPYVLKVDEFNWLKIKPMIINRVMYCERKDWDSSVAELRKHFHWEYETKQTSRQKLEPLPDDFFSRSKWKN
jgi:Immunity protein 8